MGGYSSQPLDLLLIYQLRRQDPQQLCHIRNGNSLAEPRLQSPEDSDEIEPICSIEREPFYRLSKLPSKERFRNSRRNRYPVRG